VHARVCLFASARNLLLSLIRMDADERAIYYYLKSRRPKSVPARDISRHVGSKRRFRYSPEWANPVLLRMVERAILQTCPDGSYCLKPVPQKDTQGKRWASSEIAEILRASGKVFHNLMTAEDEDKYYETL
jgi:hypothetical protein